MKQQDWIQFKRDGKKISVLTCYDFWSAQILAKTDVDALLVGDSASMVMHGHPHTVHATLEMMLAHTAAVARGAPEKLIIGDLPFLSYRGSLESSVQVARQFFQAGAHALKLEGADGNETVIRHFVESGIPVMGHLGLTPQFIHQMGGYRVQGKHEESKKKILSDAFLLQKWGVSALVLECVPNALAETITAQLDIPTIGIGAGPATDGQVLVLHDLLGANSEFKPKFVRKYANLDAIVREAVGSFVQDIQRGAFPANEESF